VVTYISDSILITWPSKLLSLLTEGSPQLKQPEDYLTDNFPTKFKLQPCRNYTLLPLQNPFGEFCTETYIIATEAEKHKAM
jgi:hypothetical protein